MPVVVREKRGLEPANDVWYFEIFGDPTQSPGLAAGIGSWAKRFDIAANGDEYEKTGASDTAWTLRVDAGDLGGSGTALGIFGVYEATANSLVGDGSTDNRAALNTLANTTIPSTGGTIVFKPGGYNLLSDLTIPSKVVLDFPRGAYLTSTSSTPVVITIIGEIRSPVNNHLFRGSLRVRLATTSDLGLNDRETGTDVVYPEWWGALGDQTNDDYTAIQRCIDAVSGYPFFDHVDKDRYTASSATAGPPGTITVTGAGWATDQWRGSTLIVESGTGSGATTYTIASNTATVITLTAGWSAGTPDATSVFVLSLSSVAAPRNASARVRFGSAVYRVTKTIRITNVYGLHVEGNNVQATEIRVDGGRAAATATGGTTTTIVETGAGWTVDQWRGHWVVVNSGTNAGEYKRITSNTATTLTLHEAMAAANDTTTNYSILPEAILDLDGVFTSYFGKMTLQPANARGTMFGVYYHRRQERTSLGSSRCHFESIWITSNPNPIFYAAWAIGARGHFSNFQEDNTFFEDCWATGNWSSGYTGYYWKHGWHFGNGQYSNNLNHVGSQVHAISWQHGFTFDATNVTLVGGSSDYCKYPFHFAQAPFGGVNVKGFRCEQPVELIYYPIDSGTSDDFATFEDIALSDCESIAYDSTLGVAPLVRWAAGSLTIKRLYGPNAKRLTGQTSTSGTTTTVTRTGAGWTVNAYTGYSLEITAGSGRGEKVTVSSNTSDTLTFTPALTTAASSSSVWNIWLEPAIYIGGAGNAIMERISLPSAFDKAFKTGASGSNVEVKGYTVLEYNTGAIEKVYPGTYHVTPPASGTYQRTAFGFGPSGSQPDGFVGWIGNGTLGFSGFESLSARIRAMGTSPTPTLQKVGSHTAGATTYNYKLVALDSRTGAKALASAAASITNCLASLDYDNYVRVYPPLAAGGSFYAAYRYVVLKDVGGTYQRLADCPATGLTLDQMNFYLDRGQGTVAYTAPADDETGQLTVDGKLISTPRTFTAADTTPSVMGGRIFSTANAGATTITQFDDGTDGQEIIVRVDANTTVQHNANIKLSGGVNYVGTANDTITLVRIASVWYEIARSVNG